MLQSKMIAEVLAAMQPLCSSSAAAGPLLEPQHKPPQASHGRLLHSLAEQACRLASEHQVCRMVLLHVTVSACCDSGMHDLQSPLAAAFVPQGVFTTMYALI